MATVEPTIAELNVKLIDASPFQHRKHFPAAKLQELANSVSRDGLVEPIVVRKVGKRYQLIAGERRLRAVRDHAGHETILSRIVEADDRQARRMCAAENLQRQDLSDIESVEAIVEIVDAELCGDTDYDGLGDTPKVRVAKLMKKLESVDRSESRGSEVKDRLFDKFIEQLEAIFSSLPKPVEWISFHKNDLPLVTKIDDDVRQVAIENKLNKSQTKALAEIKAASPKTFRKIAKGKSEDGNAVVPADLSGILGPVEPKALADHSADELKYIASRERRKNIEDQRSEKRQENAAIIESAETIDDAIAKGAKFSTIVIDPPWDWGDEGDCDQLGRARPTYQTMSIEEIQALPVGDFADENCHIYLWITNRSLPKGFALLDAWGFRYVTCLTWCKPSFGMGNYFRGSTEQVLFGVKGSLPLQRHDVGTHFTAERGPQGHSSKPAEFFALAESCSPGPYLECFARTRRNGWSAWGGEV
jgi:N6-adenosine-specific RNA methylase IME4